MKKADINEYIEDHLKGEIKDLDNPNCTSCNECCSVASAITKEEYTRLKKYFRTDKKGKEIYNIARNKFFRYKAQGTLYFICPLSNSNKRCMIYNIRPQICRSFHCKESLRGNDYERPEGGNLTIADALNLL